MIYLILRSRTSSFSVIEVRIIVLENGLIKIKNKCKIRANVFILLYIWNINRYLFNINY